MIDIPDQVRSELTARCQTFPSVKRVILYGSRARGDADDRSDIDLAIEAPLAKRREWLDLCFSLEDLNTLLKVDIVRLEEASEDLRKRIEGEGVTLFEQLQNEPKPH